MKKKIYPVKSRKAGISPRAKLFNGVNPVKSRKAGAKQFNGAKKGRLEKIQPQKEIRSSGAQSPGQTSQTRIKIIGVGGGGNSIVSEIARLSKGSQWGKNFRKVDFLVINTDLQALSRVSKNCKTLKIGQGVTGGLGCGMDPGLGRISALRAKDEIRKNLEGVDFCLLVTCLGGGTGSGATPVIAEITRSFKMASLGIFTLPFKFEGEKKTAIARSSLKKMKPNLNAVSIIPNERIFQIVEKNAPLKTALSEINQRLTFTLAGLMNMIYSAGLINLDWADFKTILEGRGRKCFLNRVEEGRASQMAVKEVVKNPLNDYGLEGADRILFNIEGDKNLKMQKVGEISQSIFNFNKKAKIIFGVSLAEAFVGSSDGSAGSPRGGGNRIGITLLATGKNGASASTVGRGGKKNKAKAALPGKNLISQKTEKFPAPEISHPKTQKKNSLSLKLRRGGKKKNTNSVVSEKKAISGSKAPHQSKHGTPVVEQSSPKESKHPTGQALRGTAGQAKKISIKIKKPASVSAILTAHAQHTQPVAGPQPQVKTEPSLEEKAGVKSKTIRKNALTLKKEIEKAEEEILATEKKWELPAFLRVKKEK